MAKIYRLMKEENDRPLLGQESNTLGVRPGIDINPQADGTVQPNTGGMSVAPAISAMPKFLVPSRLRGVIVEADGATDKNYLRVWKRDQNFEDGSLAPRLTLRLTSPTHGQVEPDSIMPFSEYETALHNTR